MKLSSDAFAVSIHVRKPIFVFQHSLSAFFCSRWMLCINGDNRWIRYYRLNLLNLLYLVCDSRLLGKVNLSCGIILAMALITSRWNAALAPLLENKVFW